MRVRRRVKCRFALAPFPGLLFSHTTTPWPLLLAQATIAEFGSGGIMVVHAVTPYKQSDGQATIVVRNIGKSTSVGGYKVQFVIL